MVDLQILLDAVDELSLDEVRQLRARLDGREEALKPSALDIEAKIEALHAALNDFWKGIPEEKIEEIITDMNDEYLESGEDFDGHHEQESGNNT